MTRNDPHCARAREMALENGLPARGFIRSTIRLWKD